ncbi:MAG: LTA synthase family protein [Turicibacter sp.]|nr:LTA synthase family protein [Turicibacter sp.]
MNNKFLSITLAVYAIILPFLLFLILEILNPLSNAGLFANFGNATAITFSVFLLILAIFTAYSLVGSVLIAYSLISAVLLAAYVVNYFKWTIAGGVFVPTDIFLANAAFGVLEQESIVISTTLLATILLIFMLHLPLYFVKWKIRLPKRLLILPITASLFVLLFSGTAAVNHTLPSLNIAQGTVIDRYREYGFVVGFYSEILNFRRVDILATTDVENFFAAPLPTEIPFFDGYFMEEWMIPIEMAEIEPPEPIIPNVIVVMSESFVDPTIWENISFSQNPVSNLHRLAEESLSGNLLVPVFGGGTANTEFEFLAGSPHVFFGSRFYIPFENFGRYFSEEISTALPMMFRQNGYRTVGIHPFHSTFFNRNRIYPLLGFDEFIALEQMPNARTKGQFVSDEYFTDRIMEEIIAAEEAELPLFLFGISMQNHWGYEPLKYGTLNLDVMSESSRLNNDELARVNSFLQGIFDADKQLGRLVDFIENRDTPTIVVFFGDHLPILGRHADNIFEKLGFVSSQTNWTFEDNMQMFQTPYLVWANYDLGEDDWGTMSAFLLGARVAEISGITLNRYFTFLLQSEFLGFTNELYLDVYANFEPGWLHRNSPHIQAFEGLWQAMMFGDDEFSETLAELVP